MIKNDSKQKKITEIINHKKSNESNWIYLFKTLSSINFRLIFASFRAYLHRLLVVTNLLFIFLDLMIQLNYSPLTIIDLFCNIFITLCFSHHILLDTFFVVYIHPCYLIQLLLFYCDLLSYVFIVWFLIRNITDIESLTFFFQLYQMIL